MDALPVRARVSFTAEMGEPGVWRAGYGDRAGAKFLRRLQDAVTLIGGAHVVVTDVQIEEIES